MRRRTSLAVTALASLAVSLVVARPEPATAALIDGRTTCVDAESAGVRYQNCVTVTVSRIPDTTGRYSLTCSTHAYSTLTGVAVAETGGECLNGPADLRYGANGPASGKTSVVAEYGADVCIDGFALFALPDNTVRLETPQVCLLMNPL